MFEVLSQPAAATLARPPSAEPTAPERRVAGPMLWRWLAATLDEIDYGTLLIDADGQVLHVNHAARLELDADHPLQLLGRQLRARQPQDIATLFAAMQGAAERGLRRLMTLGEPGQQVSISVVPLAGTEADGRSATLLMLGKRQVCGELSVQGFARSHGLTAGETRVLAALCAGERPTRIAALHGVALSTIRTQIGSIRQKTGAESIRALVRQVAVLPPLMGALKRAAPDGGPIAWA